MELIFIIFIFVGCAVALIYHDGYKEFKKSGGKFSFKEWLKKLHDE